MTLLLIFILNKLYDIFYDVPYKLKKNTQVRPYYALQIQCSETYKTIKYKHKIKRLSCEDSELLNISEINTFTEILKLI